MMDIIMTAILAACVGLILLIAGWCKKQLDRSE